ncbi:MAG: P-II family nitrogen regulator [Lentisphaeraceae bacterium]|nr:P-II family nitrogen regulator [Lentisphaeraceae bacterium]
MKMVVAVIQPEKLDEVKQALFDIKIQRMTVSRVRGCGQQGGFEESYRGQVHKVNLLDKVRIEIAINDEFVDDALKAIISSAKSGAIGDGKIFVWPLEKCIRIRTEEDGPEAIG